MKKQPIPINPTLKLPSTEMNVQINNNLSNFISNFESFKAKNNEFLGFLKNKNQIQNNEKISEKIILHKNSYANVRVLPYFESSSPDQFCSQFNFAKVKNSQIFDSKNYNDEKIKASFSRKENNDSPLKAAKFKNKHSEEIDKLLNFPIFENPNFKVSNSAEIRFSFAIFEKEYCPVFKVPSSNILSFQNFSSFQKIKFFSEILLMFETISSDKFDCFLHFVSIFQNDFLLITIVQKLLLRPRLKLKKESVLLVFRFLVKFFNSRRLNLLLIQFSNKLT